MSDEKKIILEKIYELIDKRTFELLQRIPSISELNEEPKKNNTIDKVVFDKKLSTV